MDASRSATTRCCATSATSAARSTPICAPAARGSPDRVRVHRDLERRPLAGGGGLLPGPARSRRSSRRSARPICAPSTPGAARQPVPGAPERAGRELPAQRRLRRLPRRRLPGAVSAVQRLAGAEWLRQRAAARHPVPAGRQPAGGAGGADRTRRSPRRSGRSATRRGCRGSTTRTCAESPWFGGRLGTELARTYNFHFWAREAASLDPAGPAVPVRARVDPEYFKSQLVTTGAPPDPLGPAKGKPLCNRQQNRGLPSAAPA